MMQLASPKEESPNHRPPGGEEQFQPLDLAVVRSRLVPVERLEIFYAGLTKIAILTLLFSSLLFFLNDANRGWLVSAWIIITALAVVAEIGLPLLWRRVDSNLHVLDLAKWRVAGSLLALTAGASAGMVLVLLQTDVSAEVLTLSLVLAGLALVANLMIFGTSDIFLLCFLTGWAAPEISHLISIDFLIEPRQLMVLGVALLSVLLFGIGATATWGSIACLRAVNRNLGEKLRLSREEVDGLRAELDVRNDQQSRVEHKLYLAKESAENANMVKSEFLATMSHEIRTPLNGIIPLLEILQKSTLDDEQYECATTALNSSHHLLRIINDILDFSKIEAGKLELESIEMDVREMVESVNTLMRGNAERRNIHLGYSIDDGVPEWVRGDPIRLRQVLANLVSNAIKFTQQGGVEVLVSRRSRSGKEVEMLFAVKDSGVGMSQETVSKLFRSFTQADASTTRKHGGTGLGLVISKRLVEMMGGKIGVRSQEGEGSIFWFNVPMRKSLSDSPASRTTLRGVRAFIVGDSKVSEIGLQIMLSHLEVGYQEAGSFREAIDTWRSFKEQSEIPPYDLVILDGDSLGSKGPLFLQAISPQSEPVPVPVILIGGDETVGNVFASRKNTVFLKELPNQGDLNRVLCRVLDVVPSEALHPTDQVSPMTYEKEAASPVHEHVAPDRSPSGSPDLSQETQLAGRVLIVEDNPINSSVATKLLERLGLECDTAVDGMEALETTDVEHYDVILMDCQMPRMDGYEATAKIREQEARRGVARVPVIAMTANAMTGDREMCLEAGMDDYISKPLIPDVLASTLRQWLPLHELLPQAHDVSAAEEEVLSGYGMNGDEPAIAEDVLNDLYSVMEEEFTSLISTYLESAQYLVADIESGMEKEDLELALMPAHSLKSSSANMGAIRLSGMAAAVEAAAKSADMDAARRGWGPIRGEFSRVRAELEAVVVNGQPFSA